MKFRKKPVVIDAFQWTGRLDEVPMTDGLWFTLAWQDGIVFLRPSQHGQALIIKTLEGEHIASVGDWIIRGVKGELYPCKPDIFLQTYERE